MEENELMPEIIATEEKPKKSPHLFITIGVSITLALLFVLDLVLFLLNMLDWRIFVSLLIMYLIVFPLALLIIFRAKKILNKKEVRAEVEADILKAADAPDPTRIYEE